MKARLLPSAPCTRRRISASSVSMPLSASNANTGWLPGEIEDGRHLALACAAPHQRGIASAANGEREGVEQDRLAGAGLPGEHGQALAEFEIELVDQDDVADRQGG